MAGGTRAQWRRPLASINWTNHTAVRPRWPVR